MQSGQLLVGEQQVKAITSCPACDLPSNTPRHESEWPPLKNGLDVPSGLMRQGYISASSFV